MASKKVISVIGSLNIDLVTTTPRIPSPGETLTAHSFHTGPGGKGANQAVACSRLSRPKPISASTEQASDISVYMIGAVGNDAYATQITNSLAESRVYIDGIRHISSASTGVAVILVDDNGENCILLSPGANHQITGICTSKCVTIH
jgi:ribokinase